MVIILEFILLSKENKVTIDSTKRFMISLPFYKY